MKEICLILVLGFIISTGKIVAQEQEVTIDNAEVQSLLALSETIQSGEIHFIVNEQWKGKSRLKTEEYKVIFFKTGEINKYHEVEFNYNIMSIKDSIQYIYNGETWCIIDHKKKKCEIDTNWCEIACSFPLIFPVALVNEMFSFYVKQNLRGSFLNAIAITDIQKTGNSTFLETMANYYFSPNLKNGKKVLYTYTNEYEWDVNKSILFRCNKILKDDKTYPRRTIIKQETLLVDASLNDKKYSDSQIYNGMNYVQSYKVKYR